MTPADTGFDNQFERFEEQLSAIVKDASLQPRLAEDLHGSEDVQSLLSRHSDQDSSERKAIDYRLQAIESRFKPIERAIKRRRPQNGENASVSNAELARSIEFGERLDRSNFECQCGYS